MQLHPFAVFGSSCESRTPVGHPRTNTRCCQLWNCTWPVRSHPCVWQILQNQHSAGPDNQPLQLQIYRVSNTNQKAKRPFLSQVMCSYCWGPMRAERVSQCCPPSGASCSNGACWESASQASYHNRFRFSLTSRFPAFNSKTSLPESSYLKSSMMGNTLLGGGLKCTLSWMACCRCSWVMLKLW